MPLSEHEQRILAELEESLVRHDPDFAQRVRSETVYSHAGRQTKWAVAAFVVGLAVLIAFYSQSVAAGLAGVVVMFAALVVLERNLRRMGKLGWRDLSNPLNRPRDPDPAAEERTPRAKIRDRLFRRGH